MPWVREDDPVCGGDGPTPQGLCRTVLQASAVAWACGSAGGNCARSSIHRPVWLLGTANHLVISAVCLMLVDARVVH